MICNLSPPGSTISGLCGRRTGRKLYELSKWYMKCNAMKVIVLELHVCENHQIVNVWQQRN